MTKKGQLGSYHLMITSQYFNTIEDFKNLAFATPKAKENTEKFHFNPIDLTRRTRPLFTQLETLHVYEKGNEMFLDEKFFRRVIHYEVEFKTFEQLPQEGFVYKNVLFDTIDSCKHDVISPTVIAIGNRCFTTRITFQEISNFIK